MNARTALCVCAGAMTLALFAGCNATTITHEGRPAYQLERKLLGWTTVVQVPIAKAHAAAVTGLKDLEVRPITSRCDKVSGLVDGLFADQMDFEIKLEALAPQSTRLTIRTGAWGNEARARLLFTALEKHL